MIGRINIIMAAIHTSFEPQFYDKLSTTEMSKNNASREDNTYLYCMCTSTLEV